MSTVREKFQKISENFKKLFSEFPLTLFTILMVTVIITVLFDTEWINGTWFSKLFLFAVIFGSSTFLTETMTAKKKTQRLLYYLLSAIVAALLTYFTSVHSNFFGVENSIFLDRITRIIGCYLLATITLAVYFNYKKSEKSFEEYVTHVVANFFKATIIYIILAIGIAIITSIFIFLILDGKEFVSYIIRLETLLLGFYYLPQILYAFYHVEDEIGKFIKVVIKYVLDSLVIIAFVIIYLYIAKIIILRDMPSNQIYRIIAALFILGCPIWTMTSYFNENKVFDKINNRLPFLFIPFIFLQIDTIGIRIMNNGFTESRYLCVMLIIFEMIYMILYLKNKEKIGNILIVFVALAIISMIAPFINMYQVSLFSQYHRLELYKEKTVYTQEEKKKIQGAYYYLRQSEEGEKLIHQLLTDKDINQIIDFNRQYSDTEYIDANVEQTEINIEGYQHLYLLNHYETYNEKEAIDTAFKQITVHHDENNETSSLDLTNLVEDYLLHKKDLQMYFREHHEIFLNPNQKLILVNFSIMYDEINETVKNYFIKGYLLEK